MKKLILLVLLSGPIFANDNEAYISQSSGSSNSNIDVEQLGTGNILGGADAVSGTMTPLNLNGTALDLNLDFLGDSNKFLGDIRGDSLIGTWTFDGDSNTFNVNVDKDDQYSTDSSNYNVSVTGSSNTFNYTQGTAALASTLDLDWIINGSSNSITAAIDSDQATNYLDLDGSNNTVNYNGDGATSHYFYLDHTGSNRTFNIQQQSTTNNDWLKIISNGSTTSSICVIQDDNGTSFTC